MILEEQRGLRLKRLNMRSMRRGIKEMDIILSRFAQERLETLNADELDRYEALLSENDQDLYQWVTGQVAAPEHFGPLIGQISDLVSRRGPGVR